MKTKKIQKLVKGYVDKVVDAAAAVDHKFDEEVIHDLRLQVKRLRALLRMYWLFTGRSRPEMPKRLKKVYKAAGEIRDLQLLLKTMDGESKMPEEYRQAIDARLVVAKKDWWNAYSAGQLHKAVKKLSTYEYKALPAFMPAEFIKERLTLIDELRAAGEPDDEDVHTMRKRVKDIIYMVRLVNEHWAKACGAMQHVPLQKFEEIAVAIGAFNDARQALERVRAIKVRGAAAGAEAARRKYMAGKGKEVVKCRKLVDNLLADLHGDIFS
ncbi:MAG: CHAD domain-containing protein [Taibaiella sp.]|nr:CHAD domain-containing protein [Taibaiella sp.]